MKNLRSWLLVVVMLAGGMNGAMAQNADEIMEKHVTAIGGVDNWNKIKTLKMVGSMNQGGIDINLVQTVEMGKAMRMDISAMGMSGFQIVTTDGGWMYMPFMGGAQVDTMKPDMVKAMQRQLDVRGHQMLDYKANGTKVEYSGKDTINHAACYKVTITDKEGNKSTSYFDCASYYLVRTEAKVIQDDQEQEVVVLYKNYTKQDQNVVMPMAVTAQGAEVTFKSIEINKPLDPDVFKPIVPGTKSGAPDNNSGNAHRGSHIMPATKSGTPAKN